jgi:Spy/CpxP family protein refolding chaperone
VEQHASQHSRELLQKGTTQYSDNPSFKLAQDKADKLLSSLATNSTQSIQRASLDPSTIRKNTYRILIPEAQKDAINEKYSSKLSPCQTEVLWLGVESSLLKKTKHFDWRFIEANASDKLLTQIENAKRLASWGNQKLQYFFGTNHRSHYFKNLSKKIRNVLTSASSKSTAPHIHVAPPMRSSTKRILVPEAQRAAINKKYCTKLNPCQMEIAWLGVENLVLCGKEMRFDWSFIEANASDNLVKEIKRAKLLASWHSTKLNKFFFLEADRSIFHVFSNEIKTILESHIIDKPSTNNNIRKKAKKRTADEMRSIKKEIQSSSTTAGKWKRRNENVVVDLCPQKKQLLIKQMKCVYSPGDRVYACWRGTKTPGWFPATIESANVVGETEYGVTRSYCVSFDDGDIDDSLEEHYILLLEDYFFLLKLDAGNFQGIEQYTTNEGNDLYAKQMGWYETNRTGDRVFASLGCAIRSRDDVIVDELQKMTKESDLNLPDDWTFFTPAQSRTPIRKDREASLSSSTSTFTLMDGVSRLEDNSLPIQKGGEDISTRIDDENGSEDSAETSVDNDSFPFTGDNDESANIRDVDSIIQNLKQHRVTYMNKVQYLETRRQEGLNELNRQRMILEAIFEEEKSDRDIYMKTMDALIAELEDSRKQTNHEA